MSNYEQFNDFLATLPKKVSAPLAALVGRDQISESTAEALMLAVQTGGNHHHLLAFACAFLSLQKEQDVPVIDVLRMASQLGRTVNLGWSARRWNDEHSRLSRAVTLHSLAQNNEVFDLSFWRERLPETFPGYLIPSSFRLGMEGLRNRHCVASYAAGIANQQYAIATVFVDKMRWTVQIRRSYSDQGDLSIVQIQGKNSRNPTDEQRTTIHDVLGIKQQETVHYGLLQQVNYLEKAREKLNTALPFLQEQGVEVVTLMFAGSGDSGYVERPEYDWPDGVDKPVIDNDSLDDVIKKFGDYYLEDTGIDWYNNDGGQGTIRIDVSGLTISAEVEVNYTEISTEHSVVAMSFDELFEGQMAA